MKLKSILFVVALLFIVALVRPEYAYGDGVNWNVGVAWTTTNRGANELSWRLFECTPPACRNPPNFGSSQENIQLYTWYGTCLDGRYVNTYIEGPFTTGSFGNKYKITINGQSSMVDQECDEKLGFGQCTVSTEYNGDLGPC